MNKYTTLVAVAAFANLTACSKSEEPTAAYDEAVDEAGKVVEQTRKAAKQGSRSVIDDIRRSNAEAIHAGRTTSNDAEQLARSTIDDHEVEIADMANQVDDTANELVQDIDSLSEDDLQDKARRELGIGQ